MEPSTNDPLVYFISGMWCTSCAKGVREAVVQLDGVAATDVNFASKLMRVDLKRESQVETVDRAIQAKVDKIGFGIKRQTPGWVVGFREELAGELDGFPPWTMVAVVWFLAMWSSMLAFASYAGGGLSPHDAYLLTLASALFGLPAILIGVIPYASSGLRSLLHGRRLTLDIFIFLGGASAIAVSLLQLVSGKPLSYADSGSMVIAILLLTKKIENSVIKKVSSSLLFQLGLAKDAITVWKSGAWQTANAHRIRRDDKIRVQARDTIALDGIALHGGAQVNGHLLSGENTVIDVAEGDHLFAGMIAVSDLEMQVTEPVGARRIDSWAEAALTGAFPASSYPALFSRIEAGLTTVALSGAGLLALAVGVRHSSFGAGLEAFFIGVLVFCPCLFATILPLAKQIAHLVLLRVGVELSRSEALLDLGRVKNFYFDKTGTLEEISSRFEPFEGEADVSPYLQELSRQSRHPILRGLEGSGKERRPLQGIWEIPGLGLSAITESGEKLVIGRAAYLRQSGIPVTVSFLRDFPLVALGGRVVGQIVVKRIYDAKAKRFLLRLLRAFPQASVRILSGDPAAGAGESFRGLHGRISYLGNLSPEEKAERILPSSAYIGDGLNDTLALAKADVSIRIGRRIAGFAPADIYLRAPRIELLLQTLAYAAKYKRVLIQTGAAALVYNLLAFWLAYHGRFSPLGAVLAMLFSFLTLLASTLRLFRVPEITP